MISSVQALDLPSVMTAEQADSVVRTYAPCFRFHEREAHFPSDPGDFREISRYREAVPKGRDLGWNKKKRKWERTNSHEAEFYDILWSDIEDGTLRCFPGTGQLHPPSSPNLRPLDDRNLHGVLNGWVYENYARGLFLERHHGHSRFESGFRPEQGRSPAPLLVDTVYDQKKGMVKVLYWVFYELNWWKMFLTHEGDWEHVTFLFDEEDFGSALPPRWAYFAQHNGGLLLPYERLALTGETHPVVYVNPDGHPCTPWAEKVWKYSVRWDSWKGDLHFLPLQEWRDFAGAWGEVGTTKHTTGPLGPFFKRHRDLVRIVVKDGVPHVRLIKR